MGLGRVVPNYNIKEMQKNNIFFEEHDESINLFALGVLFYEKCLFFEEKTLFLHIE